MARAPILEDLGHVWGGDLAVSPSGDVGRVSAATRSQQRVLRRLMTSQGDYLFEPDYGAGLPKRVGSLLNLTEIRTAIRGQMLREPSVARTPAPTVVVRQITGGVAVAVQYVALPDRQPVSLAFDVTPTAAGE